MPQTTPALALYTAANQAVLDILSDPVSSKQFGPRSYSMQNLTELKKIRDDLRKECEAEGSLPRNLRTSKIGVAQMQVVNPTGYMR